MGSTTPSPRSPETVIPASSIELPGLLAAIGDAGDWLAVWLAPRAVPAGMAFAMRLCLEEALANIAMHGNPDGDVAIGASLAEEPGRLVLSIRDNGHPFDPVTAELPQGRDIGGNGLLLLRRYCADIDYRRAEGRNELVLRFTLPAGSPTPGR